VDLRRLRFPGRRRLGLVSRVGGQQVLSGRLSQRGIQDRMDDVADRPRRESSTALVILPTGPLEVRAAVHSSKATIDRVADHWATGS